MGIEDLTEVTGRITMRSFIDQCRDHDIFNVLSIREVAKNTHVLENNLPNVNRETSLSSDLFGGRLSNEDLNPSIEDDLTNLPQLHSDAVLYKVV